MAGNRWVIILLRAKSGQKAPLNGLRQRRRGLTRAFSRRRRPGIVRSDQRYAGNNHQTIASDRELPRKDVHYLANLARGRAKRIEKFAKIVMVSRNHTTDANIVSASIGKLEKNETSFEEHVTLLAG
jgi:hypothetical protein